MFRKLSPVVFCALGAIFSFAYCVMSGYSMIYSIRNVELQALMIILSAITTLAFWKSEPVYHNYHYGVWRFIFWLWGLDFILAFWLLGLDFILTIIS